ncbi:hypothetical protein ACWCO0_09705 [Streptomyces tubercidicus]
MADEPTTEHPAEEPVPPITAYPVEASPVPPIDPLNTNLAERDRQGGDGG